MNERIIWLCARCGALSLQQIRTPSAPELTTNSTRFVVSNVSIETLVSSDMFVKINKYNKLQFIKHNDICLNKSL